MGLFTFSKERFTIIVDYQTPVGEAWSTASKHVVELGDIELEGREFPLAGSKQEEFQCFYAILEEDDHLWHLDDIFSENGILPADMIQLFAFICAYVKTEVTAKKTAPIVAAAPGSTWRCSYDILHEMVGVRWSDWYYNPGPSLVTISADPDKGFEKGTRFLAIRR
jgi:hypothetical protein